MNIIPHDQTRLEALVKSELKLAQESTEQALKNARDAQAHWLGMYEAAEQLFQMGAHNHVGQSWKTYFCALTGFKDDSRFRQLRRIAPYARAIEIETDELPTEYQLREFPIQTIPADDTKRVAAIYNAGLQVAKVGAGLNGKKPSAPTQSDYQLAGEVIADMVANGGVYIDEMNQTFAVDALIQNHLIEKKLRQNAHIATNSKFETIERYKDIKGVGLRRKPHPHIRQRLRIGLSNPGRIILLTQRRKED